MGVKESCLAKSIPVGYEDPTDSFKEYCHRHWETLTRNQKMALQYADALLLLGSVFDYVEPLVRRVCRTF